MLPSGSAPTVCLRCRLRETLFDLRSQRLNRLPYRSPKQSRSFTHQSRRREEFRETLPKRREKDYVWKHFSKHGEGRIIGRPGKRQRTVSEKLSTKGLDERVSPSKIIVFQDVREDPPAPQTIPIAQQNLAEGPKRKVLSAKEIEDEIIGHQPAPGESEVNASIDDLRPSETVVDEEGFDKLRQTLTKGYTFRQLSQYLVKSIPDSTSSTPRSNIPRQRVASVSNDINELASSQWQPGETPLEKRHVSVAAKNKSNSKLGIADQILRLVWHMTVQSEVQGLGELEISLQPWQLSMLFDISTRDGKPFYERFVDPPILLQASKVFAYRPDNVARVVGRRQVAEEVARQLRLALLRADKVEVSLTDLVATAQTSTTRMDLFGDEELQFVSDLTKCVVVPTSEGQLAIYGHDAASRRNAQRTLVSLLECPSSTRSFDSTSKASATRGKQLKRISDVLDIGLHRRARNQDLVRVVKPQAGWAQDTKDTSDQPQKSADVLAASLPPPSTLALNLEQELMAIAEPMNGTELWQSHESSYWRNEARLSDWEAEFCRLLEEQSPAQKAKRRQVKSSVLLQNVVVGSEALLSYWKPQVLPRPLNLQTGDRRTGIVFDRRLPFLNVHFVPSPSEPKANKRLPRMTMRFRFSAPTSTEAPRELMFLGIRAKVDEQRLKVPLPEESTDLCFTRNTSTISRVGRTLQDKNIRHFYDKLKESVRLGEGALDAPSELIFKLPHVLVDGDKEKGTAAVPDVEVRYMFERFEQVQSIEFAPSLDFLDQEEVDPEVAQVVRALPTGSYLDHREIDGGAVYGSSTSLTLRVKPPATSQSKPPAEESHPNQSHESSAVARPEAVSENEQPNSVSHEEADTADIESQAMSQTNREATVQSTSEHVGAAVENNAESLHDERANTSLGLAAAALSIARLLTRGNSGSLKRFGESRS